MRYGVISDVHGNLQALQAVVRYIRGYGVDGWICAGDVVGYGPRPNECVETVLELGALAVAGNHELAVLGVVTGQASSPFGRITHDWTRGVLRPDVLAELRRWPLRAVRDGIVVAHGSLDDPERYTRTAASCATELVQLGRNHPDARGLVLGHTHRQRLFVEGLGDVDRWSRGTAVEVPAGRAFLLNPGSVGQSRSRGWPPRACAAVLDLEQGVAVPVRVRYDLRAAVADLRRHGLPYRSIHKPPPVRYLAGQLLRRGARAVRDSRS